MTRPEIVEKLTDIMADVFDRDDIVFRDDLSADDVEEWDSLSHIRFIVAVEKAFKVRFAGGEIEGFKAVGDLVSSIERKLQP